MNKPIKAKNLPLFPIIDLDQLRRENRLEGTEVTDFFTARDGNLFIPFDEDYYQAIGKGDRGTLHQLAGTGLRRGHAGTLRTG